MRLKPGAFIRDDPALRQAEHLEAAAVGENRPVPPDEAMQPPSPRNQLVAGTQEQVIRIAEDDLGSCLLEVSVARGLDDPLRADRHEGRGLDDTVGRLELAETRRAVGAPDGEAEGHWG